MGRSEEDLARACYALAFYTELYRAGPLVAARSRLVALGSDVTLGQALGLATQAEVADLVALTMPPGACWSRPWPFAGRRATSGRRSPAVPRWAALTRM